MTLPDRKKMFRTLIISKLIWFCQEKKIIPTIRSEFRADTDTDADADADIRSWQNRDILGLFHFSS